MNAAEARRRVDVVKAMTVQSQYSRAKQAIEAAVIALQYSTILTIDLDGAVIDRLESEGFEMVRQKYSTHFKCSW